MSGKSNRYATGSPAHRCTSSNQQRGLPSVNGRLATRAALEIRILACVKCGLRERAAVVVLVASNGRLGCVYTVGTAHHVGIERDADVPLPAEGDKAFAAAQVQGGLADFGQGSIELAGCLLLTLISVPDSIRNLTAGQQLTPAITHTLPRQYTQHVASAGGVGAR